jgi:outer membrane lipoprotein-sorting protein
MNELTPKIRPIVPQSLKGNVLSQIKKRKKRMKDIRNYSAIAAVVAAFIYFPIVLGNGTQAQAMELIEQSISKVDEVKTMVLTYTMRNPFTYNPDVIDMREKMHEMKGEIIFDDPQVWKFESKNKWYIYDGDKTYWYSKSYLNCMVTARVDTGELGRFNAMFLKPAILLEKVHKMAENKDSKIDMQTKGDSITLTINHKVRSIDKYRFMTGDLFGWYNNNIKGSFITDCRQIYVFNRDTKLLRNFKISVLYNNKHTPILISEKIEYNLPVNKEKVIEISKGIKKRYQQTTLDNMSSKQAVSMILNDLKNDSSPSYNERKLFFGSKVNLDFKNLYALEILEIGEASKTENYDGELIPVKIKLTNGLVKSSVIKVSRQKNNRYWELDGGL